MNISAHLEGMDQIQALFEKFPDIVTEHLSGKLKSAMIPVEVAARDAALVDVGTLKDSIGTSIQRDGGTIIATVGPGGPAAAYGAAKEYGWKQTGSGGEDPITPLQGWVHRHAGYWPVLAGKYRWTMHKAGLQKEYKRQKTPEAKAAYREDIDKMERGIAFGIFAKMKAGTATEGPGGADANNPHPFLMPAWENHKSSVIDAMQKAVDELRFPE